MLKNGKSLDFKRFSGVEKVHRNSIKITVDLWRRWRDSNSRVGLSRPTAFRVLFALGTFVSAVVGGGSFGNGENPCAATDFGRADRY